MNNESIVSDAINTEVIQEDNIDEKVITEVMQSIPSPIEISAVIKETGKSYNNAYLNPSDNYSKYNTSFKKAINLGIYSTDLGYINMYNKNKDAILYLSSVKSLADELNIGQFFDLATIQRIASNNNNMDSLVYITTKNFEKINTHLNEKRRADQSVLILTGGWLEALHLSCEIASQTKNSKLAEKIGEQKIVLDQLMLLLSKFPKDSNMKLLAVEMAKLQSIFHQIEITYTYKESSMKEVNGVLTIVDETTSTVNITPEQVEQIKSITNSLRNNIII